jgi:phage regulator Rha-like protein
MNKLTKLSLNPVTMSSREIAVLVEKRHDNVKRTIETLAEKGVIQLPQIEEVPNNLGQQVSEYQLGKRDSHIVVAQLSPEFTARLVDRWQELEAGAPPALNMRDPKQVATAALQLIEVNQELQETIVQQQQQIAANAPKVEGFDRIAKSDGSLCLTDAAKTLQIPPRKLTQLLQEKGWVYRRPMGSGWLAYQERIQQGFMEHKMTTGEKSDGSDWSSTQARITPKGLTKLADVIHQVGMH